MNAYTNQVRKNSDLCWTPDRVWDRLVEAVETQRLLPGIDWPEGLGNTWPDVVEDWGAYQRGAPPEVRENATIDQEKRCRESLQWLTWVSRGAKWAMLHRINGAEDDWIAHCVFHNRAFTHLIEGIIEAALRRIAERLTRAARNA